MIHHQFLDSKITPVRDWRSTSAKARLAMFRGHVTKN